MDEMIFTHEIKSIVNQSFDDSHYIDDGPIWSSSSSYYKWREFGERGGETAIKSTHGVTHF
jgi:hypothetical protein